MNKPTIPEVLERFREYHKQWAAWGSLHVVLDDGNTEDGAVKCCIDYAKERADEEGLALAEILLRMSPTQRGKLGRIA